MDFKMDDIVKAINETNFASYDELKQFIAGGKLSVEVGLGRAQIAKELAQVEATWRDQNLEALAAKADLAAKDKALAQKLQGG